MPRRTGPTRRTLLRNLLASLIALDLAALAGLVADQWFVEGLGRSMGLAMVLLLPLFALAHPLAKAVMAIADGHPGIPDTGEQIPRPGQSSRV